MRAPNSVDCWGTLSAGPVASMWSKSNEPAGVRRLVTNGLRQAVRGAQGAGSECYELAVVNATNGPIALFPVVSSARTCAVYFVENVTPTKPKLNVHDVSLSQTGAEKFHVFVLVQFEWLPSHQRFVAALCTATSRSPTR